jgi:hypothetical protein
MHFRAKDLARLFMRKTAVARRADDSATDAATGANGAGRSGNGNALQFAAGEGDAGDQFDGELCPRATFCAAVTFVYSFYSSMAVAHPSGESLWCALS